MTWRARSGEGKSKVQDRVGLKRDHPAAPESPRGDAVRGPDVPDGCRPATLSGRRVELQTVADDDPPGADRGQRARAPCAPFLSPVEPLATPDSRARVRGGGRQTGSPTLCCPALQPPCPQRDGPPRHAPPRQRGAARLRMTLIEIEPTRSSPRCPWLRVWAGASGGSGPRHAPAIGGGHHDHRPPSLRTGAVVSRGGAHAAVP